MRRVLVLEEAAEDIKTPAIFTTGKSSESAATLPTRSLRRSRAWDCCTASTQSTLDSIEDSRTDFPLVSITVRHQRLLKSSLFWTCAGIPFGSTRSYRSEMADKGVR